MALRLARPCIRPSSWFRRFSGLPSRTPLAFAAARAALVRAEIIFRCARAGQLRPIISLPLSTSTNSAIRSHRLPDAQVAGWIALAAAAIALIGTTSAGARERGRAL